MMLFGFLIFLIGGVSCGILHACENSAVSLSCPTGSAITVLSANYGRQSGSICAGGPINTLSCFSQNSLGIVKSSCEGKTECQVQASNGIFGDPCGGTVKYLEVQYDCTESGSQNGGDSTQIGCEGEAVELVCPEGYKIGVLSANYGRTSQEHCSGPILTTECVAPNSLGVVKKSCEGREQCQVLASNSVFRDPCKGTRKYLEVTYICVPKVAVNVQACEHGTLQLTCPGRSQIEINFANYGRFDSTTCSGGPIQTISCFESSTPETIYSHCSGLSQCRVSASNSIFGDPCPGTVKYLAVNYHCLKNGVPVSPGKPGATPKPGIRPGGGGGGIRPGGGGSGVHPTVKPPPVAPKPPACTKSQTLVGGKNQCAGQVLFHDNFESGFNSDKWSHCVLMPWIPDYEFVTFSSKPENSYVADGCLNIKPTVRAEKEVLQGNVNLKDCTGERYSEECKRQAVSYNIIPPVKSARLHTKDVFSFRYGVVEIRAKLPRGDWIVPEMWLEPVRKAYGPDYASGRIRIAMARGNSELSAPDGTDLGNKRLECGVLAGVDEDIRELSVTREDPEGWHRDFHNYTLIWRPTTLIFLVDGQLRQVLIPEGNRMCDLMGFTGENADTWKAGSVLAPCDKDFYLSIGLSVGGIRDFPDSVQSGSSPKPWKNNEVKAMALFWKAKNQWYPTWDDDSVFQIDSIKVRAL